MVIIPKLKTNNIRVIDSNRIMILRMIKTAVIMMIIVEICQVIHHLTLIINRNSSRIERILRDTNQVTLSMIRVSSIIIITSINLLLKVGTLTEDKYPNRNTILMILITIVSNTTREKQGAIKNIENRVILIRVEVDTVAVVKMVMMMIRKSNLKMMMVIVRIIIVENTGKLLLNTIMMKGMMMNNIHMMRSMINQMMIKNH